MAYRLAGKLGSGTYGDVYRGRSGDGEPVAIKLLRKDAQGEEQELSDELHSLSRVSHAHVIRLLHVHPFTNEFFDFGSFGFEAEMYGHGLIMELATTSLSREVARLFGRLPLPLVRRYVEHILRGLAHIHGVGIIHRDLKPDNVLLRVDEITGEMQAVLGDFGSSRELWPAQTRPMTKSICTSWYRAPELFVPSIETYGVEIDMWSAGCVFGEMLLGQALFPAQSTKIQLQVITERLGPPKGKAKQMFGGMRGTEAPLVRGGLWHDPQKSYRKLNDIEAEAQNFVEQFLCWIPGSRMTATSALKHAYIRRATSETAHEEEEKHPAPPPSQPPGGKLDKSAIRKVPEEKASFAAATAGTQLCATYMERKCECSGHCMQPGHRRNGCDQRVEIASHSHEKRTRCEPCRCVVVDCEKEKLDNHWLCWRHKKEFLQWTSALQMAFYARNLVEIKLPCDVLAYDVVWASVHGDLVWESVMAVVREPLAMHHVLRYEQQRPSSIPAESRDVNYYAEALQYACKCMDGVKTPEVWENLHDQGGGTFIIITLV